MTWFRYTVRLACGCSLEFMSRPAEYEPGTGAMCSKHGATTVARFSGVRY